MTRSQALTTIAWFVNVAAVGGAALFAVSAQQVGPVFDARCGGCHTLSEVAERAAAVPAPDRTAYLARLLTRHHAPPPEERERIAEYVIAAVPR